MTNLPVIPSPGVPICLNDLLVIEASIAQQVAAIDDVDVLDDMRAKTAALVQYLKGKELHGPMLGAQRRVEARIGQLLGDAVEAQCRPGGALPCPVKGISGTDRSRFRILARGLERGLSDEDWRCSRDDLIALIQERYPVPRHVPTTVTVTGAVRKPVAERVREIEKLAVSGHRSAQIAEELHLTEESVRLIARKASIKLPDESISKRPKLDAIRILRETINGVDAYVSGLSLLDGIELPALGTEQANELTQALSRSINGLRKLRIRMEKTYAQYHAPAA